MMMSRAKTHSNAGARKSRRTHQKMPSLQDFISKRDFTGALALLEFERKSGDLEDEVENLMWIGYCAFHLGKYERAQEVYQELLTGNLGKPPPEVGLYLACVYYYMQMYKEAEETANQYSMDNALYNRILFHVCHKLNDEAKLMQHHQKLTDTNEDQLSLAAIHYLRSHFQEATDIYKRLLLEVSQV